MRPVACVLLALLLAGCSAPWGDEPDAQPPIVQERLTGACVMPYLNATPSYPALGETVVVEAALVNCGSIPVDVVPPGRCGGTSALTVEVQWDGREFYLEDPNPSALPTSRGSYFGSCGPSAFLTPDQLAPGDRLAATWQWNGSLATMYTWWTALEGPFEGTSIGNVVEIGPPRPGGYQLFLTFSNSASNLSWTRSASIYVQGDEELPDFRRMSAWRDAPNAIERGQGPVPDVAPPVVRHAANSSFLSRQWPDASHEHLGIEPAGDHYVVRERLLLSRDGLTFDVVMRITAEGKPLVGAVDGLADCRELPTECEVGVKAVDAQRLAESDATPRLVWHREGERGTFAWEIGGTIIDAQDGQRLSP